MRGRRLLFIFMLAIFVVVGISLGSARALKFSYYNDTWYKTKFKIKGVCEEEEVASKLFKESDKETAWINIVSFDGDSFSAFLVTHNEGGGWQKTSITLLTSLTTSEAEVGTPDDAVLELESAITITDDSTPEVVVVEILSFFVRLTGKENKDGELRKRTKLRSVAGAATVDVMDEGDEGFCITSLEFLGYLKKVEDVPDEVLEAEEPEEP